MEAKFRTVKNMERVSECVSQDLKFTLGSNLW